MSTLWTEVKNRYDEQALVELTNIRDVTQNEVDDTQGERAVTAVTALYPQYVQEAYDETEQAHLEIGVEGVIAILFKWGGTTHRIAAVRWDDWIAFARAYRNTGPRARVEPESSVPTTKAPSDAPSTPHTPWSDDRRFDGLMPRRASPHDVDFAEDV